jgi:hypothetical protein
MARWNLVNLAGRPGTRATRSNLAEEFKVSSFGDTNDEE